MEGRALRGVPWTLLGFGVTKVLSVATTIVLARLLVPSDFGVLALGVLIVECLSYVAGLGIGPALVVRHDLGKRGTATALSLMLLLGLASGAVLAIAAGVMSDLLREPRLRQVLLAMALMSPISAVSSFFAAVLQRELEFARAFVGQVVRVVVYGAVAVVLAANGAGVWSLVAGLLSASAAHAGALVLMTSPRVRPAFDRVAAGKLCSTGSDFVLQGSVSFLQQNIDYAVIGRVLGSGPLGLYSMAFRLSELPYYAVADPVAQVTFPGFARMRARGESVRSDYLAVLKRVALLSLPLGLLLAATARPFTEVVLGDEWLGLVGALSVLGVWGGIRPMQTMLSWLLNSVGQTRVLALLSIGVNVVLLPLVVLAVKWGGIEAVAWTMLVGLLAFFASLLVVVRRRLGIGIGEHWSAVRGPVIAGLAAWTASRLVNGGLDGGRPALVLVLAIAAGVGTYSGVLALVEPGLLRRTAKDLRGLVGPESDAAALGDTSAGSPPPVQSHAD